MRLLFLILTLCAASALNARSQDTLVRPKNAFYLEFFGTGPLVSANYERLLAENENLFLSGRIAAGTFVFGYEFPHSLFLNVGKRRSYLELGITGVYMHTSSFVDSREGNIYFVSPSVGYKYWRDDVIFFKAYFCPFVDVLGNQLPYTITPFGGFGLGYSF